MADVQDEAVETAKKAGKSTARRITNFIFGPFKGLLIFLVALFAFIILAGVSAREVFRARTTDQEYGDDKSKFQEWLDADEDTNDQNYDDN